MNSTWVILSFLAYLGLLFAVAYYAEYRLRAGRSLLRHPGVYALSMAVFCSAWTYYGSVGRASTHGVEFLTTYLGPTVMAAFFVPLLGRLVRICQGQGLTSLADLISTRYGKSLSLAVVVTLFCVLGIVPYIALQLKAITMSMSVLTETHPEASAGFWQDGTFYVALVIGVFVILFGTRSIDGSERHEGLVVAVAFESGVKLLAFLSVGLFITFGLFDGPGDLFAKAMARPELAELATLSPNGQDGYATWLAMMFLAMLAIVLLPRQFQVGVLENIDQRHMSKAAWMFPLYLLAINLFVLPVMFAGKLLLPGDVDPDTYVLALPLHAGADALGLLTFIGGVSAATGMIIVETIALSTMVSNNLVVPVYLTVGRRPEGGQGRVLPIRLIRRASILGIVLLAFVYEKTVAQRVPLVSTGLISFAAVAQLAPAVFGGMFWREATRAGAMAGLIAGAVLWGYTLIFPGLAEAGLLPTSLLQDGPFGIAALRPQALFGMEGLDPIVHGLLWSLGVNVLVFAAVSLFTRPSQRELYYADIFQRAGRDRGEEPQGGWRGKASLADLRELLGSFIGSDRARRLLDNYATKFAIPLDTASADPRLVMFTERMLSGIIGAASARMMLRSVTEEEEPSLQDVIGIVRESQQVIELNKELRRKSAELRRATRDLRLANERLQWLDQQKDEFLTTVTHELRTPLTSIRAMAEILHDNGDMEEAQRLHFLEGLVKETERLSHLITQVLNLERYESGRQPLHRTEVHFNALIREVVDGLQGVLAEKGVRIDLQMPDSMVLLRCDRALVQQVLVNLLSNAIKFAPLEGGLVRLRLLPDHEEWQVWVEDNGPGVPDGLEELIFDKFFQAKHQTLRKPEGSGLGLAISRKIAELHGGKIFVQSGNSQGACFIFALPSL